MIKILFENSIFLHQNVGGISKYITELNNELNKINIKSKIISPLTINDYLKKENKSNIFYLRFKKIPRYCRKFFFILNNIFTFFYIRVYKPDIIHFSYYNNSFLNFGNAPYVLTIYDLIHEKLKLKQSQFQKFKLINKAKHIICISKKTKKDLIKYYKVKKNKISVIYLGVNNSQNRIKTIKKKNFILFVGNRERYKNFINLIKAYSNSNFLIENYKIVCFGGGDFSKKETETFEKLKVSNKIFYKNGDDKALEKTYREASLYISLSLHEGFGLTLLEAVKSGCPVVCSNIEVFKETLKNSCIFVNPKNIKHIQTGIEKVLKSKSLQKKLLKRGNQKVKRFSWKNCAENTVKIYKKVLR